MSLSDTITKWVINDYFTPNIKAEVILDTLLTPYIPQILKDQLDIDAVFLTKEMSIPEGKQFGSIGPKIDYVLAGSDKVYLVELKTTDSSINDDQAKKYLNNCQSRKFGEKLGWQLLSILDKPKKGTFNIHLEEYVKKFGDPSLWTDNQGDTVMRQIFQSIITKSFDLFTLPKDAGNQKCKCAKNAEELIRNNHWTLRKKYSSRKYLYSLGQLVDHLDKGGKLWNRELQLVYITPSGASPHDDLLVATDFYLHPKDSESISLREAVRGLDCKEEHARLLQSIISAIYDTEGGPSCLN